MINVSIEVDKYEDIIFTDRADIIYTDLSNMKILENIK